MVEITYQMVLSTLQTIALIVGIAYYLYIMRNSQRTRELTLQSQELTRKAQEQALETRQAQLFMQIYSTWSSRESINIRKELIKWTWTDYDDFVQKYGEGNSPDANASFNELANWYEGIGVLIKRKLIDPAFVDDLMSGTTLWGWEKFGSIVRERRVRGEMPYYYEFWEYLYDEISAIAHKQHPELKT
jgi:hypothetical protein